MQCFIYLSLHSRMNFNFIHYVLRHRLTGQVYKSVMSAAKYHRRRMAVSVLQLRGGNVITEYLLLPTLFYNI